MLAFAKAVGILLMPPGSVIALALIGLLLLLMSPWRRTGVGLLALSVVVLLVFSLPVLGHTLLARLENPVTALPTPHEGLRERAEAIVILGGGRTFAAPEYGGDTVNAHTLERLRYGAQLHRATQLPLLLTGGSVFGEPGSEAALMQQALIQDFLVTPTWIEERSRNTYENALYSRAILEAAGIQKIFLVTHAWHMPRALWAFRQVGIEVAMAPTGFNPTGASGVLSWLPSARGLALSSRALSERLGLIWYRLRYTVSSADQTSVRSAFPPASISGAVATAS